MALKVRLIEYTPNPERVVASAAKLCYSAVGIDEILEGLNEKNVHEFLDRLMSYGHTSTIEHVSFTFAVEGVSRSLTHQLVRHRIASYSQQSQRYVKLNQFEYIIPPEIENDEQAKELFINSMEESQKAYDKIAEILKEKYIEQGMKKQNAQKKAIEDARYVFPNACETKILLTMNARSLMNFFEHRCCNRAQWEIRALADEMLKLVKKVAPVLFKKSGPKCLNENCPEGAMTCGNIINVRNKYSKMESEI
ncbi:FAD-dependent thymidylate synthase [Clostridium brassicae]|uniref:Flavin-dependent thymidylate synthase n=1 Tax=Clostridium brassicae TaxID=2999072 RepID=A0ABT4D4X6_9CLOT|nr:FAD-dependent thymidylate synthase [Clostridium brassicae]MCY6957340.1 FAD-dependent thymidylate synthase [Clostridium brassicae]